MHYDLNQLSDPKRFQRLVNTILTARFGEDIRLTPMQGPDGGSDGETAPANPHMEFSSHVTSSLSTHPLFEPPRAGRYLFQAKYHRTGDRRLTDLRSLVVKEFKDALTNDVLRRTDRHDINYFLLVTNIPTSKNAIRKIDEIRAHLVPSQRPLHADVWWAEQITSFLDWSPEIWHAYPEVFPGGIAPPIGLATSNQAEGLARTLRMAITQQYNRDGKVKFRQIELEQHLLDLFVDLDFRFAVDPDDTSRLPPKSIVIQTPRDFMIPHGSLSHTHALHDSVLRLLLDDNLGIKRILLEGGPGQGKSTIIQMVAQIYREKFLGARKSDSRDPVWHRLSKFRLPIRVELRELAHWISQNVNGTLEQYIALTIGRDSGGVAVSVEDVHQLLQHSSVIILLDGLDEIGNDTLRDQVLDIATTAMTRFIDGLQANVRVILTSRPPAVVGRWSKLDGFIRVVLTPMESSRVNDYVDRWLNVQIKTDEEKERIKTSFDSRRGEPHVAALVHNPMQLSVLLQFIYLKGEAFPDRRAELYRDYFQIVIDRDVEKSPELRDHRELVEGLHSYLGFRMHGSAEMEDGRRAVDRREIVDLACRWLEREGYPVHLADTYFALGEERFGLIVALAGEGQETVYGFEVQPIQEYFAAAYISNHLTAGKAHEVFESLLYRDYWREVALFLAGLRRPNEKADLIVRARQADAGIGLQGYENGRAIILQLLREGVLAKPGHVQSEAMSFAMGFLEERLLRLHPNPTELIEALSELVDQYGTGDIHLEIKDMGTRYSASDDHELVSLVHRLASNSLAKDEYIQLVLGYTGEAVETRGLVRVTRTSNVPGVIEKLGCNDRYWRGIPSTVLGRRLWSSGIRNGVVPEIVYPPGTHFGIILQFAVGEWGPHSHRNNVIDFGGASVPAIWKLYNNIQLLHSRRAVDGVHGIRNDEQLEMVTEVELAWTNGDTEPLSADIEKCLRDLIETSGNMITALDGGSKADIDDSLGAHVEAISTHGLLPGIVGWIAARCAANLFYSLRRGGHEFSKGSSSEHIFDILRDMYEGIEMPLGMRMHLMEPFGFGMPMAIRLSHDASLRMLYRVMADVALDRVGVEEKRYCSWLSDIPIPPVLTIPMVDICREELEQLLRFVGGHTIPNVFPYYRHRRLKVQDTQRILKICRNTEELAVLRGAGTVLMNASFAGLAEPELILKILSIAPSSSLVNRVFETRDSVIRRGHESRLKELGIKIAAAVLSEPDMYSFHLVNRAAAFFAEADPRRSGPLFEAHPDLVR